MHKFLRAIGFSHITKEQLQHIFADIISAPTVQKAALDSEGNEFAELSKEYGDFFGISVRGVYNEDDTFEMEYYYPYLCGKNISTIEPAEVEKHAEKESYAGICDEVRIGVTRMPSGSTRRRDLSRPRAIRKTATATITPSRFTASWESVSTAGYM